ncbi:MAG: CPBP family intramembrane glutamic endopeptidase [Candidatus Goldiibacteriota bacterium]|jgi:membrane protease YdiL (CAAX protease family)
MDKNSRGFLYLMNTALEAGIAAGAVILFIIGKVSIAKILHEVSPVWVQLSAGLAAGAVLGILCGLLVTKAAFFMPVKELTGELVTKYSLKTIDLLFISLTAAICEELLFRGALQRAWGIWPVSLLFILLHGYFTFRNYKIMLYGLIMLLISAGIGYTYQYMGLYAAISFHFVFDLASLIAVKMAGAGKTPVPANK